MTLLVPLATKGAVISESTLKTLIDTAIFKFQHSVGLFSSLTRRFVELRIRGADEETQTEEQQTPSAASRHFIMR